MTQHQQENRRIVEGRPLADGDLVEVQGARLGNIDARDSWIPMVAFDGGSRLARP